MTHIRDARRVAIQRASAFRCDMYAWLHNPQNVGVWRRFEQEANRIWASGRTHYSARTIGEYLRHHTLAADAGADFKVNDHIWPMLARLWTFLYPTRAGFFELRGVVVGVAA